MLKIDWTAPEALQCGIDTDMAIIELSGFEPIDGATIEVCQAFEAKTVSFSACHLIKSCGE